MSDHRPILVWTTFNSWNSEKQAFEYGQWTSLSALHCQLLVAGDLLGCFESALSFCC